MRRKKRRQCLNWFPPAEAALKRTLTPNIISVLLESRPPWVWPAAYNGGDGSLWYLNCSPQLRFTSLSSPSSLANSCTFLIGVWRIIRNLTWSALATVPGQRRRVLFLIWLKNRRILSLRSLCLSCNAHDSGGIFFVQGKWKNLELLQSSKAGGCERWSFQGALYKRRNLGELTAHKAQRRNVK